MSASYTTHAEAVVAAQITADETQCPVYVYSFWAEEEVVRYIVALTPVVGLGRATKVQPTGKGESGR